MMVRTILTQCTTAAVILAGIGLSSATGQGLGGEWGPTSLWSKPISNPVYTDLATIKREVNVIYIYQTLPKHLDTAAGDVALDGDMNAVAVQFELPLTPQLSLVGNKTGYVDFNPDRNLRKQEGYADIGGGLKWAFWQTETYAAALRATFEFSTGDEAVFQGNGRGNLSPALLVSSVSGDCRVNGVLGAIVPLDEDRESTVGYLSLGCAYRWTDMFSSHVEINYFRVLEEGDGDADFDHQPAGISAILENEGGDLINFGAARAEKHPDFVSAAIGGRCQFTENISLGVGLEFPLTHEQLGLMDERITADLSFTF